MVAVFSPLLTLVLLGALITLSVIDARRFILPDRITLPLIAGGVVAAAVLGGTVWLHALGGIVGYSALVLIEKSYERARGRPGLGRGDAKLFAAGGAWCGALAVPAILLFSSLAALVFALTLKYVFRKDVTGDSMIAFGPFLAFGIGLVWVLQQTGLSGPAGF